MDDVYAQMAAKWPSTIVARSEIKKFTGGAISPKTLANKDSKGIGPSGQFLMGQKVCYKVSDLIEWLRKN